jgi:transcriptional regulator with XRE-family HTH domain
MTQVKSAQRASNEVASTRHARVRTLASRRADLEQQVRLSLASDASMALTEPDQVSARLKELRKRAGNPAQYKVADALNVPPRTFQSWENGEVETDKGNYEKIARWYSRQLKQKVTANWILFGQDREPPLAPGTPDVIGSLNGDRASGDTDELRAQLDRIEENQQNLIAIIEAQAVSMSRLLDSKLEALLLELDRRRRRAG